MRDSALQSPHQLADHKANTSVKWQAPSLPNPGMAQLWRYSVNSTKVRSPVELFAQPSLASTPDECTHVAGQVSVGKDLPLLESGFGTGDADRFLGQLASLPIQ